MSLVEKLTEQFSVLDVQADWKCSYSKPCSEKRWGIGEPHWNCVFEGFCAYQFYVASEKPKEGLLLNAGLS